VPRDEQEPIEVVLHNLRSMPLVPGPAQSDTIARLRPQLEEALMALDDLERDTGLSFEERQQQEALRALRSAMQDLE
jgi:hypothetical protein